MQGVAEEQTEVSAWVRPGSDRLLSGEAQVAPDGATEWWPESAVLTTSSGAASVIVIDADNKPHQESITLGIHDNGNVEVTEGLESGERVVTAGAFELSKLEEDVLAKTKVQIQLPKEEDEDEK